MIEEIPRKRSRSVEVIKSFIEQFPDIYDEVEDLKSKITSLYSKLAFKDELLLSKEELLNAAQQEAAKFKALIQTVVQSGSMTITRSLFEIYLKDYENKLWSSASTLALALYGFSDDLHILDRFNKHLLIQRLYRLEDGQDYQIDPRYDGDVENVLLLIELRGVKGQERKKAIMKKISETILSQIYQTAVNLSSLQYVKPLRTYTQLYLTKCIKQQCVLMVIR
jgi:hypothetical protein